MGHPGTGKIIGFQPWESGMGQSMGKSPDILGEFSSHGVTTRGVTLSHVTLWLCQNSY